MTRVLCLWGCLVLAAAVSGTTQARDQSGGQTTPAPANQAAGNYVGEDTCVTCHEAEGKSVRHTLHGKGENPRAPEAQHGCETCHGPGKAHIDDPSKPDSIRRFPSMASRDVSDVCLTCHSRGNHTQWKGSMNRLPRPSRHDHLR